MSSSLEGTEKASPQSSGTSETDPTEKDNPGVTTEEIGNQRLDEKVVQTELDAKNSEVHGEAEIKQDDSVEQSGVVSIGEAASEPKKDVEKTGGLKAEPEQGSSGQETQSMKYYEHREKEPYVVFVPEMSSSAEGKPSQTKYVPDVIQQDRPEGTKKLEVLKSFNPEEMDEDVRTVLDMWGKDTSEEGDQTRVSKSSGYRFPSRSVPGNPSSELEAVRTSITSLVVGNDNVHFPGVFDTYRPPSESSSEDGTASDSGQDALEDTQTSSTEDEELVRMKLVDNTSNFVSREQESILFGGNKKVKVLEVSASGFTAVPVEPCIIVLSDKFRISFDISRFSKESISCRIVGNKVDVYALEERQNDYGYEMHEIHQIFKIPLHVDKDNFTASVKNGLLFMEAPLEIGR